jgi:galactokinase
MPADIPTSVALAEAAAHLAGRYQDKFGAVPRVYRAPGRVNLIGEHTDYNDGFVMPVAIGMYTYVAAGPRSNRTIEIHSENFSQSKTFSLDSLNGGPSGHWSDYVRGVAAVLEAGGCKLQGTNLVIRGDVPIGSGLSSSAAVEVATALALLDVAGLSMDRREVALMCQRAENEHTGTRCGIMDQFVSCFGAAGHVLLLDCRDLALTLLPIPADARIIVCNSKVKHALALGEYNRRREDCEEGVRLLQRVLPQAIALRDVTNTDLETHTALLSPQVFRRCRHVISENARVLQAAEALTAGDMKSFGRLMYQSHASLRDDYEVSCRELDVLVELARGMEGVFGARMTGGGFGGCTVNLVRAEAAEQFQLEIRRGYESATGIVPDVYVCSAADGAGLVSENSWL